MKPITHPITHPITYPLTCVGICVLLALVGCGAQPTESTTSSASVSSNTGTDSTTESTTEPAGQPAVETELIELPSADHFVPEITNEYLPLKVGSKWSYRGYGEAAGETVEVEVLPETKEILGIQATVVSDRAFLNGKLLEETLDWFAQDDLGRVWYLGEDTTSFAEAKPSKEGSWEAGVDGAKPGVVMFAEPRFGAPYYQEFLQGEAEDEGLMLTDQSAAAVEGGKFADVIVTQDTTALEPDHVELKFYAPGVGQVLEVKTSPEQGRVELVSYTSG